jgi:hypothetical protein
VKKSYFNNSLILAYIIIVVIAMLSFNNNLKAQVKIGDNPATIQNSSLLELESISKGLLMPRMTTAQRNAIVSPVAGLEIYNSTDNRFNFYNGSNWKSIANEGRDNYIVVKTVADLPTPVGGIITLNASTAYEINGTITIADKIDVNNAIIYGQDPFWDKLIYSGGSELFTGSNGGTIKNLTLTAATTGSKIFNLSDPSRTKFLLVEHCILAASKEVGVIQGYLVVYILNNAFTYTDDGFDFSGVEHLLISGPYFFPSNKGTMIKLVDGSTFGVIEIAGGFFHVQAANSAIGIDFGTGVIVNAGANLKTNIHGDGTRTTGTPSIQWNISSSGIDDQSDKVASGSFYVTTPILTNIITINTPIKAAGTTTSADLHRVSAPIDNRLTYDGVQTRAFQFVCSLSMTASANNKVINFYLAKNGVVLPVSKQVTKIATGVDARGLSLSGVVILAPGDYIEIWVENTTDSTDITLESLNLSIL